MRKLTMAVLLILSLPAMAKAEEIIRVYCKPDGVVFEHRPDGDYSEENKSMNYESVLIAKDEIPTYGNRDQFRCRNGKLIVDEDVKTPFMIRQERIMELESQLDEELAKDDPDVVAVARMQRQIEKVKKGEIQ